MTSRQTYYQEPTRGIPGSRQQLPGKYPKPPKKPPVKGSQTGGDLFLAELARRAAATQAGAKPAQQEENRLAELAQRRLQQPKTPTAPSSPIGGGSSSFSGGGSVGGGGVGTGGGSSTPSTTPSQGTQTSPEVNLDPTDADKQRAQDLVDLQYGPQTSALQRALQMIQEGVQYQTDLQTGFGERGDEKLAALYEALNQELNQNSQRIAGIYDNNQQAVGGFYDEAGQVAQKAGSGLQDEISRRASVLGLDDSQADEDILGNLQGQLGNILAQQSTSEAGTLSNIENLGGNIEATAVKAISDAARQGVQSREGLINAVQAAIADAGRVGAGQRFDVLGQLSDIAGQQGAAHRTTLQDLVEGRLDRERQSELDQLAEELQRGALDIQRDQQGLSEQRFSFDKQIQLEQLNMQKRQYEDAVAAASDPFARAQAEADLQKTLADIDKIYADINGTGAGGQDYSGIQGIRQYLQDQNIPMRYSDQFNNFMGYARGGIPLDQLGNLVEQHDLVGRVGGTVPFEQGMAALINRVAPAEYRPIYNDLLEIYLGKYS